MYVQEITDQMRNAIVCAGRRPASFAEEEILRDRVEAGETFVENVMFCSTSGVGTQPLTYWVHFTEDGVPSRLYRIELAQDLGIVTPEAVAAFMGGPRRTQAELDSQRAQLGRDTARAEAQAAAIQSPLNIVDDLAGSGSDFLQRMGPPVALVVAGYFGFLLLKALD